MSDLLAHPEAWSDADLAKAQMLHRSQTEAAAAYDQRDRKRVASMQHFADEIARAIERYHRSR